jgi:hypothetical protein
MSVTRPLVSTDGPDWGFSPVDNEPPLRWFRRGHLVPANGLGAGRRAIFFALLTWLPIVLWAAVAGRLVAADSGEPLLWHFGVHARCLLAIPLLILAEAALHRTGKRVVAEFRSSGLVGPEQAGRFDRVIADMRRLRDASMTWVFVIGIAIAWVIIDHPVVHDDRMSWAAGADATLGFAGLWYAYVARPIFLALVLGWFWRTLLVGYCLWRIGKLDLAIVPTHPDRTGGLAFAEKLPGAFAMVTLALSAVVASRWAHEVAYHGATLQAFKLPAAALVIVLSLVVLVPLLALAPALLAARARAIPAYAALVGEQGRLVHRRWIVGDAVADGALLDAPEIGPVADAGAMYEAVTRMRVVPIGKAAILKTLVPIALPLLVVVAMQIPLKALLLMLVKALV